MMILTPRSSPVPRLSLVLSLSLLGACSDYGVSGVPKAPEAVFPDIEVEPGSLTFGELAAGEEAFQSFTVRNVGSAALHVSDIVIGSGLSFEVIGDPSGQTELSLDPGAETDIEIRFSPVGADENFGQALVLSDDPDEAEVPVDLLGIGATPELSITPETYMFEDAFIPCGSSVELTLQNVGNEDLVISEIDYTSGGMLSFSDGGLLADLPLTLAPGEQRIVEIIFDAATVGADTGVLEVTSNDPRGVVSADQSGEGSYAEENTEAFTEPGIAPVDVMFLIDQSCSMTSDNIDDVENGIPAFIDELQTVADWQLIEVTQQNACANGGILTPSTPNPDTLLIDNAFNAPLNIWTEALLRQANEALQKTDPGECNEGFLRPGALLHIIIVSDEPDSSANNYSHWLGLYEDYVTSPDYVKVSGVLDLSACGGGNDEYLEAANETGGSVVDICDANWGANLSGIASEILAGIRTYNLSEPAVAETIVVTVNGTATTDFVYTPAGNSVTINSPPVGEGDVVEVTYAVALECE